MCEDKSFNVRAAAVRSRRPAVESLMAAKNKQTFDDRRPKYLSLLRLKERKQELVDVCRCMLHVFLPTICYPLYIERHL